eukprot:568570_1
MVVLEHLDHVSFGLMLSDNNTTTCIHSLARDEGNVRQLWHKDMRHVISDMMFCEELCMAGLVRNKTSGKEDMLGKETTQQELPWLQKMKQNKKRIQNHCKQYLDEYGADSRWENTG